MDAGEEAKETHPLNPHLEDTIMASSESNSTNVPETIANIDEPDVDVKRNDETLGRKEIDILSKYEHTSQEILEVAGLQQTVNVAVFFLKANLIVNYVYYITSVTIIVSILAQILLACLVAAKIWIRKCAKDRRTGDGSEDVQRRLRRLDFLMLLLMIFISILTTILLALSGIVDVTV